MHEAALHGHLEMARWLHSVGVPIDPRNDDGETPLLLACRDDQLELIQFLHAHGAKLQVYARTGGMPLHAAAECGSLEVVQWLVANTSTLSTRPRRTARSHCSSRAATGIWRWPNSSTRAGPLQASASDGETPLHAAAADGTLELVQWLVAHGADVRAKKDDGEEPLTSAWPPGGRGRGAPSARARRRHRRCDHGRGHAGESTWRRSTVRPS